MNKQNFDAKDRFPLSTQALAFMQDMILASANLARIGGDNYILSGCEITGSRVAPGVIVINGEIMPFEGGTIVPTITIVEQAEKISANGLTFEEARVTRKAQFARGTGTNYYPWAAFRRLQTNKQLEEAKATVKYVDDKIAQIQAGSIPTGVIVMWSGAVNNIPKGWQLCDNSIIPGTNQRVPDLRGRFIVGFNNDDDDYKEIGKKGGKKEIALSEGQLPRHRHCYTDDINAKGIYTNVEANFPIDVGESSRNTSADGKGSGRVYYTTHTGGNEPHENRPPYYVLAFIIKIDTQN